MANPSKTLKNEEFALKNVIETLIDGQEGFKKVGEELQDETLKSYFLAESLEQAKFRGALESVLHQEGVRDIEEHGTANGKFLRAWGALKSKLGGGDKALLSTAEEAAEEAVKAYEEALESELPLPVRQMLVSQGAHTEAFRDYVKAARESRQ